jgi:predicted transcriptional regulator
MQETYAVTSVRLPGDLRARFDELARVSGRSRNDLIVEAMTRYVEAEMAYIAAVQEGLADIEAGRHRDLDEIAGEWVGRGVLASTWRDDPSTDEA